MNEMYYTSSTSYVNPDVSTATTYNNIVNYIIEIIES